MQKTLGNKTEVKEENPGLAKVLAVVGLVAAQLKILNSHLALAKDLGARLHAKGKQCPTVQMWIGKKDELDTQLKAAEDWLTDARLQVAEGEALPDDSDLTDKEKEFAVQGEGRGLCERCEISSEC